MIRIDLRVSKSWRFDFTGEIQVPFLHFQKLWIMDNDCYGEQVIDLSSTKYAWDRGVVRVELDRFEKKTPWTDEDIQIEFDKGLKYYIQDYAKLNDGKDLETSDWWQYKDHGKKYKKNMMVKIRKLVKEVEKYNIAFTNSLIEYADMSEKEANNLADSVKEKIIKCKHFGFENLIQHFWFKIGESVIVFVDNELSEAALSHRPETIVNAKAMLMD